MHGFLGVGKANLIGQRWARLFFAALLAFVALVPPATLPAIAGNGGDRTLYLYHTHTKQTGSFTFRKNGAYDQRVLKDLNVFLADWRTKEPTRMDPALFDLLWAVYQEVGGRNPINIVSSYRSPKTNAMLASKSSGVADNSQHMKGKAIDFFIPGVDLSRLRAVAMKHQVGGVGYYPTSGSPFVHLDTGTVRAWPRMTTAQLKKVFPDGKTLHIPADGKVLSAKGRQYAEAEWKKCRQVPCGGALADTGFAVADALDSGPGQRSVSTISVAAPVPAQRPARADATAIAALDEPLPFSTTPSAPLSEPGALVADLEAPIPASKSQRLVLASAGPVAPQPEPAMVALAAIDQVTPAPRVLMTDRRIPDELVTAYAASSSPDAQRALEMIISRETTAALPPPRPLIVPAGISLGSMRSAATGTEPGFDKLDGMLDLSFSAITSAGVKERVATAVERLAAAHPFHAMAQRNVELVAPDFDHIAETMVQPVLITSSAYADFYEPDEAPTGLETELGSLVARMGLVPDSAPLPVSNRFVTTAQLLVASN